jgi:hypothetical protein
MAPRDPTTAEIKIRVRGDLRQKLEDAVERHGMTLNAEVVMRLEQSFELDALKRELEIERQYLREANNRLAEREVGYQQRINQLTDYVFQLTERERQLTDRMLQLTAPKLPVSEEPK